MVVPFGRRFWGPAVVLAALLVLLAGCAKQEGKQLKVVTGTSLIAAIVRDIGQERVDVTNIVPPAQCPGHFDLKPSDVEKLANARLFLRHEWQGEMFTEDLIASVHNPELKVVPLAVAGNWMAPPVQKQAVEAIAGVLAQADPANKEFYEQNAGQVTAAIVEKEKELRRKLDEAGVAGVKVLCSEMQQGFLKWAGCEVVGTYGRPEELTPEVIRQLVEQGRAAGVRLVVDNLQSGPEAGAGIARELGVPRVTLSNFPGGFPGTDSWSSAVEKNVNLLIDALAGR